MRKIIIHSLFSLILSLQLGCQTKGPVKESTPGEKLKPYLGVSFRATEQLPEENKVKESRGIELMFVLPQTPAEKMGLRAGDIIVKLNGKPFQGEREVVRKKFLKMIEEIGIGEKVVLNVRRPIIQSETYLDNKKVYLDSEFSPEEFFEHQLKEGKYEKRVLKEFKWIELEGILGKQKFSPGDIKLGESPLFKFNRKSTLKKQVVELFADKLNKEELDELTKLQASMSDEVDFFRKKLVAHIHRHPFEIDQIDSFIGTVDAPKIIGKLALMMDVESRPHKEIKEERQAIKRIIEFLKDAERNHQQALRHLSPSEVEELYVEMPKLLERLRESIYFHQDMGRSELNKMLAAISSLPKIRHGYLLNIYWNFQKVFNPKFLNYLKTKFWDKNFYLKTQYGEIIIANGRDSIHGLDPNSQTKIVIDVGGNDHYRGTHTQIGSQKKMHFIVDLAGDDRYSNTKLGGPASNIAGATILIDKKGNDVYQGVHLCQGSSIGGISVLIDEKGNDRYLGSSFCQGMGFFGIGSLIDEQGDDEYVADIYSQGVGVAGGVGGLWDLKGNDTFRSQGNFSSSYGTPGVYRSYSQGSGVGLRGFASGGIGLLYDGGGKDRYESGNFSQGSGYYFGLGALIARGEGDDQYFGSRYSQGSGAHQAISLFIEESGNDRYRTAIGVSNGIAWDLSVSLFKDKKGDDSYPALGMSLGSSAENSFAFFIEEDGDDQYLGSEIPGQMLYNKVRGGSSFSFFADLNGRDHYQKFKNGDKRTQEGQALAVDL